MRDMTAGVLAQLPTANIMEAVNILLGCGYTRREKLLACLRLYAPREAT